MGHIILWRTPLELSETAQVIETGSKLENVSGKNS